MTPKLSIITSVLNGENTLPKTIESLFPIPDNVEWVFVDGGSTDRTIEVGALWSEPHLHSGCSLYAGFNHGLRHSKGEFVYFLNSGDKVLPEGNLRGLVNELNESDVYYFDTQVSDGSLFPRFELDRLPYRMCFSHQGCVMKRESVLNLGGFSETSGPTSDHELLVKLWLTGHKFESLHYTLTQCAPFESTEDYIGRLINRWRNVRNLYKTYRSDKLEFVDRTYYGMIR